MAPWATAIIERLDTYTEISPSQHGVKLWLYGSVGVPKHGIHRRGSQVSATLKPPELEGGIECYSQRRFFTVTGNHYPGTPSTIETRDIRWLIAELVPDLSPTVRQSAPLVVPAPNTPSSRGHRVERYLEQACQGKLKDACSKLYQSQDGERHHLRYKMGRLVGGLVHYGYISREQAIEALYHACPPQSHAEKERKAIADGLAKGELEPLAIPIPPACQDEGSPRLFSSYLSTANVSRVAWQTPDGARYAETQTKDRGDRVQEQQKGVACLSLFLGEKEQQAIADDEHQGICQSVPADGRDDRTPQQSQPEMHASSELSALSEGVRDTAPIAQEKVDIWECFEKGEAGDALLYAHIYRGKYVFDTDGKKWYTYVGPHWKCCDICPYESVSSGLAGRFLDFAQELDDKEKSKGLAKRVMQLRSLNRIKAVLTLASEKLAVTSDIWDANTRIIACKNGIIDLQTGDLREGKPEDFVRIVAPVEYPGKEAAAPRWEKFLAEVFEEQHEMIQYLQVLLGYALMGVSSEKVLPLLWGKYGWNGRTTMMETLGNVLGAYARSVSREVVVGDRHRPGSATPHVMALRGKRLIWTAEIDKNSPIKEDTVKQLTGNDQIIGRRLYEEEVVFKPTHTLFLLVNTVPNVSYADHALWQRMKIIPFTRSFVPNPSASYHRQAVLNRQEQLLEERGEILAWLVRGCLLWQQAQGGLSSYEPQQVVSATQKHQSAPQKHQSAPDPLAEFLTEKCASDGIVPFKDLYAAYCDWYGTADGKMTKTSFGKALKEKEYTKKRMVWDGKPNVVCYTGIQLLPTEQYEVECSHVHPTLENTPQQQAAWGEQKWQEKRQIIEKPRDPFIGQGKYGNHKGKNGHDTDSLVETEFMQVSLQE